MLCTSETVAKPFLNIHESARAKFPFLCTMISYHKKKSFLMSLTQELEAHFKYIQEQGFTPISIDLLLEHLQKGIPLPDQPVLLSFDDGLWGTL